MEHQALLQSIKDRAAAYRADPKTLHNQPLHDRILATWKQDRPAMYQQLQADKMLEDAAFVAQQDMWAMQSDLLDAGMAVTDAREQAEAANLMLTPETYSPIDPPPELETRELPESMYQ